jgi:hypothetical protein
MTAHPFGQYPRALVSALPAVAETAFPVAQQIIDAHSHAERAAIVLRLSDDLIHEQFDELKRACLGENFSAGAHYLSLRLAAQLAVRDAAGQLPMPATAELELWRRGLVAMARVWS